MPCPATHRINGANVGARANRTGRDGSDVDPDPRVMVSGAPRLLAAASR